MAPPRPFLAWPLVAGFCAASLPAAEARFASSELCVAEAAARWVNHQTCRPRSGAIGVGCVGNAFYLDPLGVLDPATAGAIISDDHLVDWDGDGDLDKLIASGSTVRYYERVEGGSLVELDVSSSSLSTRTRLPLQLVPDSDLLGYDWDGDTDADLLIGEPSGKLRYFDRRLSGELRERTGKENPFHSIDVGRYATPYVTDIDGDGHVDLIVKNGTDHYLGFRSTLAPHLVFFGNPPLTWTYQQGCAPFVVDWDGDGTFEVLLGFANGSMTILDAEPDPSTGGFVLTNSISNPFEVVQVGGYARPWVVDWDGDGVLDVLVGAEDGRIHYYQRQGGSPAGQLVEVTDAQNPFFNLATHVHSAPQVLDVDGDGDLDLVTGALNDEILVFLREANGDLQTTATSGFYTGVGAGDSASFSQVSIVDWDHDGTADVLTVNATDSVLWFIDASADYTIGAEDVFPPSIGSPDPLGIYMYDIDFDGDLDVVSGWSSGSLRIFLRGRCEPWHHCSLKGACDLTSGMCECHTGYEGYDCSLCSEGFFSHLPDSLPQRWECKACPSAESDNHVCSWRGVCSDDKVANRSAIEDGLSNSQRMFAVGAGTCTCQEPFSGDACDEGVCLAGFELVTGVVSLDTLQPRLEFCEPCREGMHKTTDGNHVCLSCADGLPSLNNGTGCACPSGTYFLGLFAEGAARCVACAEEENHVTCAGGMSPPVANAGYYLISYDVAIHCTVMVETDDGKVPACRGGSWFEPDDVQCEPGHTGPLCGACKPMYARDKGGVQCTSCDTDNLPSTPFLYLLLVCQLVVMSSWAIFLTKRATASIMLMRTDAIMFRILNQWIAVNSVLAVLDFKEVSVISTLTSNSGSSSWSAQAASNWLQSIWPVMTYGMQLLRIFNSQLLVECIMERRLKDQPVPETQIKTLVAPLIWWELYPLFMAVCLALQLLLFVKFSWPMSVRYMPAIGQAAVSRVLQAHGVSMQDAQKAVNTFTVAEIIHFMQDPSKIMNNPETIHQRLGRNFLCQITANKVREQIIKKLKHLDDPDKAQARANKVSDPTFKSKISRARFNPHESEEHVKLLRSLAPLGNDLYNHQLGTVTEIFRDPEGYLAHLTVGELMANNSSYEARIEVSLSQLDNKDSKDSKSVSTKDSKSPMPGSRHELDTVMFSGHHARDQVVLGLYGDMSAKTVFWRSAPVFLIAIYNATDLTTERFYQTFHARSVSYPDGTQKFLWMSDTRIEIGDETHMQAYTEGLRGWILYCFGYTCFLLIVLAGLSRRHKLQTHSALRNFGYFYNGMEPRKYFWELGVKRLDVLSVQAIAYTTLCVHARSKLFMYSLLAVIFLSVHYLNRPFDDRQGKLLDRLEGQGLQTRFLSFQLLQIAVLFGSVKIFPAVLVLIIILVNFWFVCFFLACIAVELASSLSSNVDLVSNKLPRFLGMLVREAFRVFCFVGNEREDLERNVQRFVWMGAGRPIQILHHSNLTQRHFIAPRRIFRRFLVYVYKLGPKAQREFAAALVGQTMDHMVTTVKCQQLSAHTFDFIFTLPVALRRLQARGLSMHDIHPRQVKEELYEIYREVENKVAVNPRFSPMREEVMQLRSFEDPGRAVFSEFYTTTRDLGQALLYLYRLKSNQVLLLMMQAFLPFEPGFTFTPRAGEETLSMRVKSSKSTNKQTPRVPNSARGMESIVEDYDDSGDSVISGTNSNEGGTSLSASAAELGKVKLLRAELQLLRTELCVAKKRVTDKKEEFAHLQEDNRALREVTQTKFAADKERALASSFRSLEAYSADTERELSPDPEEEPFAGGHPPPAQSASASQAQAPSAPGILSGNLASFWRTSLTQVPANHRGAGLSSGVR